MERNTIEEIKKELGLSQKDLAEFFDMSYGAFANSTAKHRYENALCSFYDVAKKAWEEKIKEKPDEPDHRENTDLA